MNDTELRQLVLFQYNILRNHLIQTRKLESVVEMLLARDPVARSWHEEEQKKEGAAVNQANAPEPLSTSDMLLLLAREIERLTPKTPQ